MATGQPKKAGRKSNEQKAQEERAAAHARQETEQQLLVTWLGLETPDEREDFPFSPVRGSVGAKALATAFGAALPQEPFALDGVVDAICCEGLLRDALAQAASGTSEGEQKLAIYIESYYLDGRTQAETLELMQLHDANNLRDNYRVKLCAVVTKLAKRLGEASDPLATSAGVRQAFAAYLERRRAAEARADAALARRLAERAATNLGGCDEVALAQRLRQLDRNRARAAYKDEMTPEGLSFKTGIPLPYATELVAEFEAERATKARRQSAHTQQDQAAPAALDTPDTLEQPAADVAADVAKGAEAHLSAAEAAALATFSQEDPMFAAIDAEQMAACDEQERHGIDDHTLLEMWDDGDDGAVAS